MLNLIKKPTKILLILLFFFLPLVVAVLPRYFWMELNIYVNGNFDFTKVVFFNVLSWIILLSFLFESVFYFILWFVRKNWKKNSPSLIRRGLGGGLISITSVLIISSILSFSPYVSILWNNTKWHSLVMFINLIWMFIIISSYEKYFVKTLLKVSISSSVLMSIIAIKEYFYPTFDYWDLSNRAIWTMGHPNYIALHLLVLVPFLYRVKSPILKKEGARGWFNKTIWWLLLLITIFTLLLTKSAWGFLTFLIYNIYYFLVVKKSFLENIWKSFSIFFRQRAKALCWQTVAIKLDFLLVFLAKKKKKIITIFLISVLIILIPIIFFIFPEKISSFISRFFIWWTTLKIIFSDAKIFLFWWWLETLELIFDNYKSQYLYIFENIWLTASRPHNLLINVFYHTWIFWLSLLIYFIYKFIKGFKKNYYFEAIALFLFFTIFNFSSISTYLLLILFLVELNYNNPKVNSSPFAKRKSYKFLCFTFLVFITSISITWAYFSYRLYLAENHIYNKKYNKILETYKFYPNYYYMLWEFEKWLEIEWFKSKSSYSAKISSLVNIVKDCENFTEEFWCAENYFYCWEYLEMTWHKDLAIEYYKTWLTKLPDLRNENSKYYNNFLLKKIIDKKRFFSEKYSNIKIILEKVKLRN